MTDMTPESLVQLGCEERYDYFISRVAEERELWIVINDEQQFLKIYSEDDQQEYVPVWPDADSASLSIAQNTDTLEIKAISVPEFFKKWVPGLTGDNIEVGVFPGDDDTLWITSPAELKADLEEALSNFF